MSYVHTSTYKGIGRDVNLFVCSIYSYGNIKYLGVIGNFIKVNNMSNQDDWSKYETPIDSVDITSQIGTDTIDSSLTIEYKYP